MDSAKEEMEMEKKDDPGKRALRTAPLVHVLRISMEDKKKKVKKEVYGSIFVFEHFNTTDIKSTDGDLFLHDLYNHDHPQDLNSDGNLTLIWPDFSCHNLDANIPMFINKINAQLYDVDATLLIDDSFSLDDTEIEGGYNQFNSVRVPCLQGSLSLVVDYIAIPFGISGRLEINFESKKVPGKGKHDSSMNVNGKIVASWVDTYGNYPSEECVLFQKDDNAFERVEIDGADILLSRCWVAVPAYSSLVISVDLSDYDTGRKFVGSVKVLVDPGHGSGGHIVFDDLYIRVCVSWWDPIPLGRHKGYDKKVPINAFRTQDLPIDEEMDTEEEDDEPDQPLSNIHRPAKLCLSPAIEIFSIFVGRKESKAVILHGSIEVCSNHKRVCYLFNSNESNEKRPLFLSQHMNTAPVPDGSRLFEDDNDLEIKFDMKDIGGNVAVKGYERWDGDFLEEQRNRNKQLCCFIQGEQGFLALHYSVFSDAVFAHPKVFLTSKSDVYPTVYGSLTCQYRNHFYSSKYNKDYYRIVLFTKTQGDAVQLHGDGLLPLCRSKVVVPYYSPLIINLELELELECGFRRFEKVSSVVEFEIGDKRSKTADISDFTIRIEVDWSVIN